MKTPKIVNPFNDPELKRMILESENKAGDSDSYEIMSPSFGDIISSAPTMPDQVKNIILDATALEKSDKDKKAQEMSTALSTVFTQYNKEYNTDLQIDFGSLTRTLVNVSDPRSRETLELYLSEVFQSIRPVLILHMMNKLAIAIDYILDPQRMFGPDMTVQDTFIAVEKIMQFMTQLEDMKKEIIIKGSDLRLKKLAEESGSGNLDNPEAQKAVDDFMDLFMKENGGGL